MVLFFIVILLKYSILPILTPHFVTFRISLCKSRLVLCYESFTYGIKYKKLKECF